MLIDSLTLPVLDSCYIDLLLIFFWLSLQGLPGVDGPSGPKGFMVRRCLFSADVDFKPQKMD